MITTVAEIMMEHKVSPTLAVFRVSPEKNANWFPGMFMQISLIEKTASEPWLDSKPFTIASWGDRFMRIIVRKEGKFTSELFSKGKNGISGSIRYPLGNFLINTHGRKVLLAGGAGISAFTPFLDFVSNKNLKDQVCIYHSSRTMQESLNVFYWKKVASNVSVKTKFTRERVDGEFGKRLTFDDLKDDLIKLEKYEYYVCGPPGFTKYWVETLRNENLKVMSESWIVS